MAWSYSSVTINGKTYSQDTAVTLPAGTRYYSSADGKSSSGTDTLSSAKTVYYYGYNDTYVGVDGYDPAPYYFCASAGGSPSGSGGWRYMKAADLPYATYTIKYNANGGSGAPSNQTKTYGTNLTLSSTKPTRTGYTFKGWSLTQGGSVYYQAGSTCGKNENLTLWAVWEEHYLTVNYYSNYADYCTFEGASVSVSSTSNVKVLTSTIYYDNEYSSGLSDVQNTGYLYLRRTGYSPTGKWGASASGGTLVDQSTSFNTGQALAKALGKDLSSGNASVNVYAQWRENKMTINYYSNYATSSFEGALNGVGSDKNVVVLVGEVYYDTDYSKYGLANYSNDTGSVYMTRIGYTATGNWGTSTSGGTLIHENTGFANGQAVAEALGKSLKNGDASINLYAQWEENTLTVNYYSNYATSAFEGALSEVGADKNVIVNTYDFGYESDEYYSSYGLGNYSHSSGGLYMERTRYDATGYWCTTTAEDIKLEGSRDDVVAYNGGIAIGENALFDSGQELAEYLGLTLEDGSKEINLYAHWVLLASRVIIYLPDEDGNIVPKRGLVHIYDDKGDLHYGILTVYTDEYDENGSNAHVVI